MKFSCDKDQIVKGISIVMRAISNKNTNPVLSGILLETQDNQISLSATDTEIGIKCTVPALIEEHGKIVLPARYLFEMIKRFPSGNTYFSKEEDSCNVKIYYSQGELNLNGFDPEQFPVIIVPQEQKTMTIDANRFRQAVKQVAIGVSHDDIRQIFTGVHFEILSDGTFTMIATDTHRLVVRKESLNLIEEQVQTNLIVPGKTLIEISRLAEDVESIQFYLNNNQIVFRIDETLFISRLIDGQFPLYQQVVPPEWKSRIVADTRELLSIIERASLMVREETKYKINTIRLELKENRLLIDSYSPEIGKIHEEMLVEAEGEQLEIIFNGRYLLDLLRVIDSEKVAIEMTGSLSAAIFRPVNEVAYFCLVLPMRVQ